MASDAQPWIEDGSIKKVDKPLVLKGDASKWLDEKKNELRSGTCLEVVRAKTREVLTVQSVWDELAGTREKEFRDGKLVKDGDTPQTVLVKFYRWEKRIKSFPIAERPMKAVNRDDACDHVEQMKEGGASLSTMKDVLGVLELVPNKTVDEKPRCKSLANPFVRISLQTEEEAAMAAKENAERQATQGPDVVTLVPKQRGPPAARAWRLAMGVCSAHGARHSDPRYFRARSNRSKPRRYHGACAC